jgi:hypothetical protein
VFAVFSRSFVHGTIVVPAIRRHCDHVTRMRFVPSHNGNAELKRPPGEGPSTVRTSLRVARSCAGPARPALAATGCVIST